MAARGPLALLRATHPLPAAAVTFLVTAVAFWRGARGSDLLFVALSTGAGQASVGWSNDFLDRDRDRLTGRDEKPIVSGEIDARTVWLSALLAYLASVVSSLPLGIPEASIMFVAVGSAWLYNATLKSSVLSFLPYAVSFGFAPVYVWVATDGRMPPAWIVALTAFLGVAAHLLNVIPDLESDSVARVRGLPHVLGLRRSLYTAAAVLVALLGAVLAGTWPPVASQIVSVGAALLVIAALVWAGRSDRGRIAFRLTILAAAAIVATFLLSPDAARL